ncbi:MAG TPA: sulfatase-like hydrolase/transferase [Methylophilaceae bacterium]|nr:sulfatase-like hydrolase/transferase [Methylophilaceae bacterium]
MRTHLTAALKNFALLSWLHMLTVTWAYFRMANPEIAFSLPLLFHVLTWANYSLLYLLPGLLPAVLLARFWPARRMLTAAAAILGTSLCILFIRSDSVIYDLYSFHFNGFVVNLLTTPGGIASLGGGNDTYVSIALIALGHALVQAALWKAGTWFASKRRSFLRWHLVLALLVLAMVGERVIYGVSDIRNDGAILDTSRVYPFYGRTTFRGVASKFGVNPQRQNKLSVTLDATRLNYPLQPVAYEMVVKPPNIVMLVAESLRWDRLTPEIMPNTWRLAQRGQHFKHHYSSGNGTREGLFGMFYGLYGSYWSSFLYAQKSPLLMDRLQELGYQFDLRTSAAFSYPEFNKTLFANIPLEQLHEEPANKEPWQRDQDNASALINFLQKRDPSRPFMSFFFFESTHARYSFPDSAIIARPYLENVNYSTMTRASLAPRIDELLNRYTNSAHWLDVQIGRIIDELEQKGLLDNTFFFFYGDHREEFLEKGFWGHNSSFVEQQILTPMVVWMPGMQHSEIDRVTSHLDVGTTLMQILGAPKDASGYSLGRNLFDTGHRPYVVSSDWHSISVITDDIKYRIPYDTRGADHWSPTKPDDTPYSGQAASEALVRNHTLILDAIKDTSRFTRKAEKK